jgi:hypothetical protein
VYRALRSSYIVDLVNTRKDIAMFRVRSTLAGLQQRATDLVHNDFGGRLEQEANLLDIQTRVLAYLKYQLPLLLVREQGCINMVALVAPCRLRETITKTAVLLLLIL